MEHYNVSVDETTNQITCWVASENDKSFALGFKKITDTFDTGVIFFVDGCFCGAYTSLKSTPNKTAYISYARVSETEVRNLKFRRLETTDDDAYIDGLTSCSNIGEIQVICEIVTVVPSTKKQLIPDPISESTKIHERSKKSFSHRVGLGPKRQKKEGVLYECTSRAKFATFIFRYRPLEVLQAMGIAPQPPSPQQDIPPSTSPTRLLSRKRTLSGDTGNGEDSDDITELEKDLLAQLASIRDRKRAKKANAGSGKVKEEPKSYFLPGEIIDLT